MGQQYFFVVGQQVLMDEMAEALTSPRLLRSILGETNGPFPVVEVRKTENFNPENGIAHEQTLVVRLPNGRDKRLNAIFFKPATT